MKTKLLAMMLLAGGSMFAQTRFSIGMSGGHGGGFYQPPPYASNIPPCPGPDYTWVDGYWSQDYGRNIWVDGYWDRQPFRGGYQVAPRFDNRFHDRDDRRGLLAASKKTETEASTRVDISAGKTAIRPVVPAKARHAILGRIKTRIRTVGIAAVQTAKTTAWETITQTDSEAANQPIGEQVTA